MVEGAFGRDLYKGSVRVLWGCHRGLRGFQTIYEGAMGVLRGFRAYGFN